MRYLFLVGDYPITPNSTGGSSVFYSHLELLAHSNNEIVLVTLRQGQTSQGFDDYTIREPNVWQQVRGWCLSHEILHLERKTHQRAPFKHLKLAFTDSAAYTHDILHGQSCSALKTLLDRVQPDVIWAEHRLAALLVTWCKPDIPLIYSHHDWEWRISKQRQGSTAQNWRKRLNLWLMRRVEENLVRSVAGCVSGSASEMADIRKLGSRRTEYFPTTYSWRTYNLETPVPCPGRIVHLGGMKTTANRLGLQRFMQVCWEEICRSLTSPPELWIVGSMEGAPASLIQQLNKARAVCTGFVPDLSEILRPYDVHIIPWEHNTGTRTRIPLILREGQVLLSTQEAASCITEIKSETDCVLVSSLSHMTEQIVTLLPDEMRRTRIGKAARETFRCHFTREALQPRFDAFLEGIAREGL